MGSRSPEGKGQFLGFSSPLKSGIHSKKSVTASIRLLQLTALLPTGQCHSNVSPMKNPSHPSDAAFDQHLLLYLHDGFEVACDL